ncbi:PREDICTED: uncharacterized protein LOC105113540 isoform X1 [Populus euphratica]|uniref:Uncharacterized protein LOC105113540 isoform X1 n=1 Tax=Populus euphratica TaxID=75702 RepID=A0AAJ6TB41_POPEU|nr:PREDICTED: uncharacterized protein LOC105113540 isoform X1 [Populus euphratica]
MALASRPKKEIQRIGIKKSKNMLYSGTSLASVESLTVPLVQVVVLSADIRCAECQRRVADIMSRMNEVETHMTEKQQCRISARGRFRPSDVATKRRKKMNHSVEILDTPDSDFGSSKEQEDPTPVVAGQHALPLLILL